VPSGDPAHLGSDAARVGCGGHGRGGAQVGCGVSEGGAGRVDRSARPFDPGLQPERTALAWRRTALALLVGSLVGLRVLPLLLGDGGMTYAVAGLGVAASVAVLVGAHRRYRRVHRLLTSGASDRAPIGGGLLPAAVALLTLAAGLGALALALAGAAGAGRG
jgi:putative membrane protein